MKIYLDTNLWNELCDQGVEPELLLASLDAMGVSLVLSHQTVYEFAKCFRNSAKAGPERGRKLFDYLNVFTRRNTCCTKEIMEVLAAEMWALQRREPVKPFLSTETYGELNTAVEKLANGHFDERVKAFVEGRVALAARIRSGPNDALAGRPDVQQRLRGISEQRLAAWLDTEAITDRGAAQLANQITRRFPEAPAGHADEWAAGLLASSTYRLARALVRADLYYSWRCANRGSIPKDLFDDMYHVLNAIYCDVYATKEPSHAQYAGLLLTADTKVAVYDGNTPVGEWIKAMSPSNYRVSETPIAGAARGAG